MVMMALTTGRIKRHRYGFALAAIRRRVGRLSKMMTNKDQSTKSENRRNQRSAENYEFSSPHSQKRSVVVDHGTDPIPTPHNSYFVVQVVMPNLSQPALI
jgi:hypothetical protein